MDQQNPQARGRSPSATAAGADSSSLNIKNEHSPSPASRFPNPNEAGSSSLGLGLGLGDPSQQQQQQQYSANPGNYSPFGAPPPYSQAGLTDPSLAFDLSQGFTDQLKTEDTSSFGLPSPQQQQQQQQNLLAPSFDGSDFTIFPPTPGEQQYNAPLFVGDGQQQLGDQNNMMAQNNPTPPHLLGADPNQPGSAAHSPSFNQTQFPSSPGRHSRNVSLGPEAALLPRQLDWSVNPQFQGHRRSPSEYSDVSSAAPSPHLVSADSFDSIDQSHSPMQRPQDSALFSELNGITTFSISDHGGHSPGRSPSHSPAISPRILPQQLPDMSQQNQFMLRAPTNGGYGPAAPYMQAPPEAFPSLSQDDSGQQSQMPAPPSINIDFAPTAVRTGFDQPKNLDIESLVPPERGRRLSRPRAVTDPYNSGNPGLLGAGGHQRSPSSGSLSPNFSVDGRDSSRSLSPLDRSGTSPNRRRQSTSSVPNNVIALRLADPEYNGPGGQGDAGGGAKRVQKHPATFQCTLCPKRFTRAYNLRSHLRTHTDERPFVCTVCGKAFARQHDRKRHEGLHSGEKKFVCKGDLKGGGQWGCGRRFARADALGRHFRSEAGRICIKPLLDEEILERQRVWNEQRMQQAAAQGMMMQGPGAGGMMMPPGIDPNTGYPIDASGNYQLPQALLAQYPVLAQMNWSAVDMGAGSGMEDEAGGRSSFDASDLDDDENGYVSGPGTGFGQGGMGEGFGEMGYASDFGGGGR